MKWQIRFIEKQVVKDHDFLVLSDFEVMCVHYEDFVSNRNDFYKGIYKFIGLTEEAPEASGFKVIIKSLKDTLKNYDEVIKCASEMGYDVNI